jgi:NitT/TauT family transport system ATP-binding protein
VISIDDRSLVETTPAVSVVGLSKSYRSGRGALKALDSIDLEVPSSGLVCLVGASGCGKTTLLNILAGLDRPSAGRVEVRGRTALMFQESSLFPWLTVAGNIELALRLAGVGKDERASRTATLLEGVHLAGHGQKRPHELSGGMRQRAALARALAQDADVLLMDEPFAALDAITRDALHDELERLWSESGLTVVFVTHNVREAARLGDRIVLLTSRPGRVARSFPVDIPRPRRIESPDVSALAGLVTEALREEVRRHGAS